SGLANIAAKIFRSRLDKREEPGPAQACKGVGRPDRFPAAVPCSPATIGASRRHSHRSTLRLLRRRTCAKSLPLWGERALIDVQQAWLIAHARRLRSARG